MTIQMLKPSIQHRDHHNSKKFPKTSSEFNSEYPMGQREPSWFHFSLQVPLLGSFLHLFHSAQAYHTAQTSSHHSFFPFFFLHYVLWQEDNNWPGQRTCLLPPSFICSSVHTARQEKRKAGDHRAKRHWRLATTLRSIVQCVLAHYTIYLHTYKLL